jgi:hypothetical protein
MTSDVEKKAHADEHEDYLEAAKNALIFAILFIVVAIALWGYVYLTMLERGMTQ